MPLPPGSPLGRYEVVGPLGAGGMGEVYRARDTRIDRTVAIKVLPAQAAADPQFRERFEREARTIGALEHPHICPLYDVGQHDGVSFLVMPLIQGETLAERLTLGPLPIDQACRYAAEVADALDAAHRAGVVHRDLKPGNVMLTKSGALLLDFGLARLATPDQRAIDSASTQGMALTEPGSLLGTVPYMAPEQIEGRLPDHRSDIFALGAVIFEMVTGRRPFDSDNPAGLMAAILRADPPSMSASSSGCPPILEWAVGKCLAKDPEARWQSARDLSAHLHWIGSHSRDARPSNETATGRRGAWAFVPMLAAAVAGAMAVWLVRPTVRSESTPVVQFTVDLPDGVELQPEPTSPTLVLSPDGRQLVFTALKAGDLQIFVRGIDAVDVKPVAGTVGADNPFLSPDAQWLGFNSRGLLNKVALSGGTPVSVMSAPDLTGASWSVKNEISLAPTNRSGLVIVPASGGASRPATTLDDGAHETSHRFPEFLPDGEAVLFTAGPPANSGWYDADIVVQSLATGERRVLIHGAAQAHYVRTGHLVYARAGALYAVPFDAKGLRVSGTAVKVLDGVSEDQSSGDAQFTVSATGSLAYVPGGLRRNEVLRVDRSGKTEPLIAEQEPRLFRQPRFSPDGHQVAISIASGDDDVWVFDLSTRVLNRFTSGANHLYPGWTPDGARLSFFRSETGSIMSQVADRGGPPDVVLGGSRLIPVPHSWSPDGAVVIVTQSTPATGSDIFSLRVADGSLQPVVQTTFAEYAPALSPDGRWLAYSSDETGRFEVYVQPFPGPGPRRKVSRAGGGEPVWARSGRELFFREPADKMMVASIVDGVANVAPRKLFELPRWTGQMFRTNYDVAPDGEQFVVIRSLAPEPMARRIHVVLNWAESLKTIAPSR